MIEVTHEVNKCIGCGSCAAIEPKHWAMKGDKSHLKNSKSDGNGNFISKLKDEDYNEILESAQTCPVDCIKIKK